MELDAVFRLCQRYLLWVPTQNFVISIPLQESILRFDYSVADERDTAMQGSWDEDEAVQLEPMRSVCIIPAAKMPTIMQTLESALTLT